MTGAVIVRKRMHIVPLGDTAILVNFGDSIDERVNARLTTVAEVIREQAWPGVLDAVPSFCTLALHFDPVVVARGGASWVLDVRARLARLVEGMALDAPAAATRAREVALPVCYEPRYAPDLEHVAEQVGMDPGELVRRHCGRPYRVYLLGFSPGFPYLGGLDPALSVPRRAVPRIEVPAGSVAIGGAQTGIYPATTPGGWHLIGRTPVRLFDANSQPYSALQAGDVLRFEPISAADFDRYAQ
jgi:inhibitor of KinA